VLRRVPGDVRELVPRRVRREVVLERGVVPVLVGDAPLEPRLQRQRDLQTNLVRLFYTTIDALECRAEVVPVTEIASIYEPIMTWCY
jgi:hypothetical protein